MEIKRQMAKTTKKGPAKKVAKTGRCKHCGAPMKKMEGGGMNPRQGAGMKCIKCGKTEKY